MSASHITHRNRIASRPPGVPALMRTDMSCSRSEARMRLLAAAGHGDEIDGVSRCCGVDQLFPNRPESRAHDAVAAQPIVNRRRERITNVPRYLCRLRFEDIGIIATRRDGRQWLAPSKMNETIT